MSSLSNIAMFIGAALNYPMPECNGTGIVSTIKVHQFKQKFDQIRIYCDLAHPELVQNVWCKDGRDVKNVPDVFVADCLLRDARHYRNVYLAMLSIIPGRYDPIVDAADYYELLFHDAASLDKFLVSAKRTNIDYMIDKYSRLGVKSVDDLRVKLYEISHFTLPVA